MEKQLKVVIEDGAAVVTIDRESKMNALNKALIVELGETVTELVKDKNVKGIVLTGSGSKAFAAGADISEFTGLSENEAYEMAAKGHAVFEMLERSPIPVIAAVNGFALGGGCELAMACHFRYASPHAKFGQPEVNLGIIPGYGGTQRLVRLVGRGRATELMMTANMISAEEALQMGLVNKVVESDNLIETCKKTIDLIASKAPLAIRGVVESVHACFDKKSDGMDVERKTFAYCASTNDFKEGATAFLEKRKADFKGN